MTKILIVPPKVWQKTRKIDGGSIPALTTTVSLDENAVMENSSPEALSSPPEDELPDRLCAWCKIKMNKRLVGEGRFIHYTCPACIFQHTSKRE